MAHRRKPLIDTGETGYEEEVSDSLFQKGKFKLKEPKDAGYWITLTRRLPIENPPPILSLHWSVAWANMEYARSQFDRYANEVGELPHSADGAIWVELGKEPDWLHARKIRWNGGDVRIFPHEFTKTTEEKLLLFTKETHDLQAGDVAHNALLDMILKDDLKPAYESLLLEGCTKEQAILVLQGMDIDDASTIPPTGWYKLKPQYQEYFGE